MYKLRMQCDKNKNRIGRLIPAWRLVYPPGGVRAAVRPSPPTDGPLERGN